MNASYEDIRDARREAEATIERTNIAVRQAAQLIVGHLRSADVDRWTLRDLKRELQQFDSTVKRWKPRK